MANLSERLAERAKKTATEKGRGRSAFLALKPEIQHALDQGWSAKEIWSLLLEEDKIAISYSVFLRYIRANGMRGGEVSSDLPQPPAVAPSPPSQEVAPASLQEQPTASRERPTQSGLSGTGSSNFKLDSKPDKGSLV
ncbi:TraK family protein [Metapseudomonas furukawaii]|uniref:TraK family protein n=1 Tax=Metapseudomonas furukawaii TaxID=1149133 RepID=UPI000687A62E